VYVRPANVSDIPELARLRVEMLANLNGDPGQVDESWWTSAHDWFRLRLSSERWAFRVVDREEGHLSAAGAAWLTEHLPSPDSPTGERGYIGFFFTEPAARRRGYARLILTDLLDWLGQQSVTRLELNSSTDGVPLYRSAGFVDDPYVAMYRSVARD
jgi:GNAT superfamily N-acetyltransferase